MTTTNESTPEQVEARERESMLQRAADAFVQREVMACMTHAVESCLRLVGSAPNGAEHLPLDEDNAADLIPQPDADDYRDAIPDPERVIIAEDGLSWVTVDCLLGDDLHAQTQIPHGPRYRRDFDSEEAARAAMVEDMNESTDDETQADSVESAASGEYIVGRAVNGKWIAGKVEEGGGGDDDAEALRDLFETEGWDEPEPGEVFEYWAVSSYLGDKLKAAGATVAKDCMGLTIWGRQTTGQAIAMDAVIRRIVIETGWLDSYIAQRKREAEEDARRTRMAKLLAEGDNLAALIEQAMDVHIYDADQGEAPEPDCGYVEGLKNWRAAAEEARR